MSSGNGCLSSVVGLVIVVLLAFAMMFGLNSCTDEKWNGGECPHCETRYELRGVSKGLKYYSCPGCGQEVQRYFN